MALTHGLLDTMLAGRSILRILPMLLLAFTACDPATGSPKAAVSGRAATDPPSATSVGMVRLTAIPDPLADSTFAGLVQRLSEPGGYFDTDNLISNESSYLHVIGGLEELGIDGGAYIGVGPDQNFSYISAVRPGVAFMIDIRRDNLLQHLWLKALFHESDGRLGYLCLMVVRACGGVAGASGSGDPPPEPGSLTADALAATVEAARALQPAAREAVVSRVVARVRSFGVPLSEDDLATIRAIHDRFADDGLGLRFNTHGRAPQPYYPTLRRLVLETDREGRQVSYLASDDRFDTVRRLQLEHRVIPLVGDLAGEHAVREIGKVARELGLEVTAFYTSNVEDYLARDGALGRWIDNIASLPLAEDAVIIRSYFNRFRPIPGSLPGYASTQILAPAPAMVEGWRAGEIRSYRDLVLYQAH